MGNPWQLPPFRQAQGFTLELPLVPSASPLQRLLEAEPLEPSVVSVELDATSQLGTLRVEVETLLENGRKTRSFLTGGWGVAFSVPAGRTVVNVASTTGVVSRAFGIISPGRVVTEDVSEVRSVPALSSIVTNPPRYARAVTITPIDGDVTLTAVSAPTLLPALEPVRLAAGLWTLESVAGGTVHLVWEVVA